MKANLKETFAFRTHVQHKENEILPFLIAFEHAATVNVNLPTRSRELQSGGQWKTSQFPIKASIANGDEQESLTRRRRCCHSASAGCQRRPGHGAARRAGRICKARRRRLWRSKPRGGSERHWTQSPPAPPWEQSGEFLGQLQTRNFPCKVAAAFTKRALLLGRASGELMETTASEWM